MNRTGKFIFVCVSFAAVVLSGCTSAALVDRDFRTSIWEELWLDGTDALADKRFVDARRILELAAREARGANSNMRLGVTLDRLAEAYAESEMSVEAEKTYEEAIAVFDRSLKEDKDDATEKIVRKEQIGTLSALAQILIEKKKYKAAEQLLAQAVTSAQLLGGNDMQDTRDKQLVMDYGSCLQKLGTIYEITNRSEDAQKVYVKATRFMSELTLKEGDSSMMKDTLGSQKAPGSQMSNEEIARQNEMIRKWTALHEAASQAYDAADHRGARENYFKAYELARAYKPTCDQAMDSLTQLIKMLNKSHQYAASEQLIASNLSLIETSSATKPMDNALGEMSRTYLHQRKWQQAEKLLKIRVKFRETIRGANNFHVAETLYELANVYAELGDKMQAEFFYRKALKILIYNGITDNSLNGKIEMRLTMLKSRPGKSKPK
jgi:tetratricopeptide (TPR) repeat protein